MGMFDSFKQGKEMLSQVSELQKMQKKLSKMRHTKEHKGVTITLDGTQSIKSFEVSDELMKDKKQLEKAVVECIEAAKSELQRTIASEMGLGM